MTAISMYPGYEFALPRSKATHEPWARDGGDEELGAAVDGTRGGQLIVRESNTINLVFEDALGVRTSVGH